MPAFCTWESGRFCILIVSGLVIGSDHIFMDGTQQAMRLTQSVSISLQATFNRHQITALKAIELANGETRLQ
jgi:uncharacterized protein with FMN-binding domain